jgi:ABC-2 type transport system ATP-binding protein
VARVERLPLERHIVQRAKPSIGLYVPDGIAPWPEQPVQWALEFSLDFLGGRRESDQDVVEQLELKILLGSLSKGQRKRVLLGLGLLSPQPILLIHEPFEGLDLRQTKQAMAALRRHVAGGRTLFVPVHPIAEADRRSGPVLRSAYPIERRT